ncbi:MAG: hypothetical protein IT430_03890 [Phycisphaerales bacterium]|nr:hypothetical protein [Phycisphaerales bacterium]
MSAYRKWFFDQCAADGLNFHTARAVCDLRRRMSDWGWKSALNKIVADRKRREAAKPPALPGDLDHRGRAA